MARQRTGSALDTVDESDRATAEVGIAPELPDAPKPVPAGHLRVDIHARRNRNDDSGQEYWPPGIYDLPKDEAMHFVKCGAAKIVAA